MTPLKGIRILDLGIITAGAATSALLGDMGAEVIKLESPTYKDPFRIWVSLRPEDKGKLSPHYGATNRGKKALAINLKDPAGRACFLALVARADVLVENFRRGVLDKLGLGFEVLKQANPKIVLASVSSQGETGPGKMQVSYGSTLECVAGMAWQLGYDDTGPMVSGVDLNYPDQVAAIFAAGMVVTALTSVKAGGAAVHLDLSQRELTSFMLGETFAQPDSPPVRGNADPEFAVQDCFMAQDGRWLALSVTKAELPGVAAVMGLDRAEAATIAGWVASRPAQTVAETLTSAGIAASVALKGEEVLAAGVWSSAMAVAPNGAVLKGTPFDLGTSLAFDTHDFGADTIEILETLGGYSRAEINDLLERGIVVAPKMTLSADI